MTLRTRRPLLAAILCLFAPFASAELTLEELAAVRHEEQKAIDQVNAAHGNRKSSEMSSDERRQLIREHQEASSKVLERFGVSAKEYGRASANLSPEKRRQLEAAQKALAAQEEARRKAAAAAEQAAPTIEYGIPPDELERGEAPRTSKKRPKKRPQKRKRRR